MSYPSPQSSNPIAALDASFFQLKRWLSSPLSLPLIAATLLLLSSFLPWLHDPFGSFMTPWQLPLDPAWQFHSPLLSYGCLCTTIALCICLLTLAHFLPFPHTLTLLTKWPFFSRMFLFCLLPPLLFLFQMLACNFSALARIAQHERQVLLIQRLFLYPVADQLIPLSPFVLHTSTFWGRAQLLIDQLGYGLLLPLLASILLLLWQKCFPAFISRPFSSFNHLVLSLGLIFSLALLFVPVCIATICEKQAQNALSSGSYEQALSLLNTAHLFLPTLDTAAFYHLERGQALYYRFTPSLSPESQAYLAATYRIQHDFPAAFQQNYALWKAFPSTPWISDELCETLEMWIASLQPLKPTTNSSTDQTATSLSWLQILVRVDPTNIYALYLEGRIAYAYHAYPICLSFLSRISPITQEPAILSSLYTYQAFSEMALGHLVIGRELLFKALTLDPTYRNNTAREALSGLH